MEYKWTGSDAFRPGGIVIRTKYDGACRVTAQYTTNRASGSGWSNPSSVANDVVLAQTEMTYDSYRNAVETIACRRNGGPQWTRLPPE